jgi:hypothetical protein
VEDGRVRARYLGWAEGAGLLTDERSARDVLIGKGAAISARLGKGVAWLIGPHLEHPSYPGANDCLGRVLMQASHRTAAVMEEPRGMEQVAAARRLLSEARVALRGLEMAGERLGKVEPGGEGVRRFLDAMWERVQAPEEDGLRLLLPDTMEADLSGMVRTIRGMRRDLALGLDAGSEEDLLLESASCCASSFFNAYFDWRLRASLARKRRG